MSNNRGKNWFRFGWHPAEEDLLLFLDGETSERQADKVRAHLEGCWACRALRDKLDRAIATFMDYCEAEAIDVLPPSASLQFAERLRIAASTQPKPSLIQRWAEALHWRFAERRIVVAATACLLLMTALGLIWMRAERPVSARELLHRAAQAEMLSLSRVGEPVVYRKLLVKRAGEGEPVVWESWSDAERNQFRQRVTDRQGSRFLRAIEKEAPAVIAELEQIFRANRFDPQRPLSAAAFAEWRRASKTKAETVAAQGDELKLTTVAAPPYTVNAITEAALIVRKSDWHAVALRLRVQGENELRDYELAETAYEVLPLQALTVFADLPPMPLPAPSPSVAPVASPARLAASPAVAPSATLPTVAQLQEAEVAALFALHQLQADLGEQLEVTRAANQGVIVRGLVEKAERKQQLREALQAIPLVNVQIQTVAEATQRTAPRVAEAMTLVGQPAGSSPFEQRLLRYFQAGGLDAKAAAHRVADFAHEVVTEAAAARAEAWALRRLAERYPAEQERELTPAVRRQIAVIVRRHQARLLTRQEQFSARLLPVYTALGGVATAPASPGATDWQTAAQQVFQAAEQFHQITNQLLAGAGGADVAAEEAAQQQLDALARLASTLTILAQVIQQ